MKSILTLAIILFATATQAQLTETTTSSLPVTIGSFKSSLQMSEGMLIRTVKESDTIYTLRFRLDSHKKTKWNTISFKETGGTLSALYILLKSFFTQENNKNENYKKTFKLGDQEVICSNFRTSSTSIDFRTSQGMFYINEKQLEKLFGFK